MKTDMNTEMNMELETEMNTELETDMNPALEIQREIGLLEEMIDIEAQRSDARVRRIHALALEAETEMERGLLLLAAQEVEKQQVLYTQMALAEITELEYQQEAAIRMEIALEADTEADAETDTETEG